MQADYATAVASYRSLQVANASLLQEVETARAEAEGLRVEVSAQAAEIHVLGTASAQASAESQAAIARVQRERDALLESVQQLKESVGKLQAEKGELSERMEAARTEAAQVRAVTALHTVLYPRWLELRGFRDHMTPLMPTALPTACAAQELSCW